MYTPFGASALYTSDSTFWALATELSPH